MCVTLAVIGIASALGGLGASYIGMQNQKAAADFQAKAAAYQETMRQQQLQREADQAKLAAAQTESVKTDDFMRRRSAALAAIGASGLGEDISFFQGIDPEQQRAILRDVSTTRLNLAGNLANIADQIQISGFRTDIARYNAESSKVAATMQFAGKVMETVNSIATYASGGAKKGASSAQGASVGIEGASLYDTFGY